MASMIFGRRREASRAAGSRDPSIPVVHVGKAAIDEGPHEIECERGTLVAAKQQLRIRFAIRRCEYRAIDEIAAIARQRHAIPRFGIG